MCKMTVSRWLSTTFLLFVLLVKDSFALKNVVLKIEPKVVALHKQSILRCLYDLEDATLYTVKWYRGNYEFYRYTPSEHPTTKIFPFNGINVDIHNSNSTQVLLTKIEFHLAGSFTCEVTTTDEPISTGTASESMLVVQLPEKPPTISVGRDPLDYGDVLRANCSSPPARPPASLKFILNNVTVALTEQLTPEQAKGHNWSDLSLQLTLTEFHFNNGKLILRCVAQIDDIYHEEATLQLESARDPVPEKVSAENFANPLTTTNTYFLQIIIFSWFLIVQS